MSKLTEVQAQTEKRLANSKNKNAKLAEKKVIPQNSIKVEKLLKESANSLFSKLSEIKTKEKKGRSKEFIYKFQLNEKLDSDEQKSKRSSLRKKVEKQINNLLFHFKNFYSLRNRKDKKELHAAISEFFAFFSETYINTNLADKAKFSSLEEEKKANILYCMELVLNEISKTKELQKEGQNKGLIFIN